MLARCLHMQVSCQHHTPRILYAIMVYPPGGGVLVRSLHVADRRNVYTLYVQGESMQDWGQNVQ